MMSCSLCGSVCIAFTNFCVRFSNSALCIASSSDRAFSSATNSSHVEFSPSDIGAFSDRSEEDKRLSASIIVSAFISRVSASIWAFSSDVLSGAGC